MRNIRVTERYEWDLRAAAAWVIARREGSTTWYLAGEHVLLLLLPHVLLLPGARAAASRRGITPLLVLGGKKRGRVRLTVSPRRCERTPLLRC